MYCRVASLIESSYEALAISSPDKFFVYGETGKKKGGKFKPHKTHRNGLSVDFMVPVTNARGHSIALPTGVTNKYGYALEFDSNGRLGSLAIDFEALAAHLASIARAAEEENVGIRRVIFDPELQPHLRRTKNWAAIAKLSFSKRRSWVRHDEHYHVDFDMPCNPLLTVD